uniref:Uncharacterized protein n=1 Tax=Lotus japonicus TaxID=34305 RepID=I3T6X7_LOTJA|nr:unknown [Lotus japonicus]
MAEEEEEAKALNSIPEEKSYVKIYGVKKATEMAEELRDKAKEELDGFEKYGELVFPLYSFVDYAFDRSFSVGEASG